MTQEQPQAPGGASPQERLRALLHAAVEPIQPSPQAYELIRERVARRARWRAPLLAAAGVAAVVLVALAIVALLPSGQATTVEPPPVTAPSQPSAPGSPGQTTGGDGPDRPSGTATAPGRTGTSLPLTGSASPPASDDPTGPTPATPSASRTDGHSPPGRGADVDGDGQNDQVRVTGGAVEVTFAAGSTARAELPGAASPSGAWSGFDADSDGRAELIVQTATTSGMSSFTLLRYAGPGRLDVVPDGGAELRLQAGPGAGFRCLSGGGLEIVRGVTTDGGQNYSVTRLAVELTAAGLARAPGSPSVSQLTAAEAAPLFLADCAGLR
ncbi:MAG: VCBS repeat-containing protein [Frankia sp.]|nr:VCBS repeat-containing protein [Frankia sp.]